MESMLSNLCKTVDVLQVTIRSDDVRPRTSGDVIAGTNGDSQFSRTQQQSPTNMSNHEQVRKKKSNSMDLLFLLQHPTNQGVYDIKMGAIKFWCWESW